MEQNLDDLLQFDAEVQQYYLSLPEAVQEAASRHAGEIGSMEDLRRFSQWKRR